MTADTLRQLVARIKTVTDDIVRAVLTAPIRPVDLDELIVLQDRYTREFPVLDDPVAFWETLWLETDTVRAQWTRIEKAAARAGADGLGRLQPILDDRRRALYHWTRRFIGDHAPVVPTDGHFELGIETTRRDYRERHERIEGLYESVKRIGRLPTVREGVSLPGDRVNFAVIYGGGWNVSSFSILREAANHSDLNALIAFDHGGGDLFGRIHNHDVRLAPAGLVRADDRDEYVLATFERALTIHFVCPHEWTGRSPYELGIPVLRSPLTLDIVDDKTNTTRALAWYAKTHNIDLPLIPECAVPRPDVPVELDKLAHTARAAVDRLYTDNIHDIVIKPTIGEQAQDVAYFTLPEETDSATRHAAKLALETGAVIQQRIRPHPTIDFTWRVLVARNGDDQSDVVGRFARKGHAEDLEMVADRDMLAQCQITGPDADRLLNRLNHVSRHAFQAVAEYAQHTRTDLPPHGLDGGAYATPYFLGIDLIGNGHIVEINGNEVAGMWTDDRLYPETNGRSTRTVLRTATAAAKNYRAAIRNLRTK